MYLGVTLIGTWGNIGHWSKLPHFWGNFDPLLHIVFLVFGMRLVCEIAKPQEILKSVILSEVARTWQETVNHNSRKTFKIDRSYPSLLGLS